jgi:hypothetical protein
VNTLPRPLPPAVPLYAALLVCLLAIGAAKLDALQAYAQLRWQWTLFESRASEPSPDVSGRGLKDWLQIHGLAGQARRMNELQIQEWNALLGTRPNPPPIVTEAEPEPPPAPVAMAPDGSLKLTPKTGPTETIYQPSHSTSAPAPSGDVPLAGEPERIIEGLNLTSDDRVLFAGDSMMQGVAPHLARMLRARYQVVSVDASKQSTGLDYPGFFNWPQTIADLTEKHKITVLVVFIGANDAVKFPSDSKQWVSPGTDAWREAYRTRVAKIMQHAKEHHLRVLWLGLPSMARKDIAASVPDMNSIYQQQSQANGMYYYPTELVLGGPEFQRHLEQPGKGRVQMRLDDGVHFTLPGQQLLARAVMAQFHYVPKAEPKTEPVPEPGPEPKVPTAASAQ